MPWTMSTRACPNVEPRFSIREARAVVRDLFEPNAAIYWTDFLLSMVGGDVCFFLSRRVFEPVSVPSLLFAFAACVAYYRSALFIHELIHLREGSFRIFRIVWNMLCGIPFLMPSFLYYTHLTHHARKHYGTPDDGEYLPLATRPRTEILKYLLQPFVIPALAVVRFLILTPLAWVSPRFRRLIHQRASCMVMDPAYVRPLPTKREWRVWRLQETLCFLFVSGAAVLFIRGLLPISLLVQAYLTAVVILCLNHVRTLGAHRYRHRGEPLTFVDQLLDSVNFPRHPLTGAIWAPVGLRFHALHHLFPSLPYHALGKAHRRLMTQLPADSPYRLTESPSLVASIAQLWQTAERVERESRPAVGAIPRRPTFDRSHV